MKVQKQGSQLVITVDLADVKSAPLSASGKSRVLYSTSYGLPGSMARC